MEKQYKPNYNKLYECKYKTYCIITNIDTSYNGDYHYKNEQYYCYLYSITGSGIEITGGCKKST